MRKKNVYEDKRLLDALDHIDEKYIAETEKYYRDLPATVMPRTGSKITVRSLKQIAVLAACLVLLSSVIPLVTMLINHIPEITGHAGTAGESNIPETNENETPENNDLPEEYFTDGTGFLSYPSYFLGIEYDGCWIRASGSYMYFSGAHQFFEYLYKYDPVAKTSTSLCIDSACKHTDESCPAFIPVGWTIDSITVFDDWCLYMYSQAIDLDSNNAADGTKVCIYNIKTGEARVIAEKSQDSAGPTPKDVFAVDGKVYLSVSDAVWDEGLTVGTQSNYIVCYDPATDTADKLCDTPANMYLVGVTNKRFFLSEKPISQPHGPSEIWTIDHSGENFRKMANLTFHPMFVCGTLAYGVGDNDTVFVYDLTTNTASAVDFGEPVQHVFIDSGELGFTTTSRIEEFNEYQKDPDAYIAKNYPNVTNADDISRLKSETEIKLNCKVKTQFYLTDARGENKTLVFEAENINFNPYRRVGDYIIGYLRKASKYETRILEDGFAALNLKTGEITLIPAMKFDD